MKQIGECDLYERSDVLRGNNSDHDGCDGIVVFSYLRCVIVTLAITLCPLSSLKFSLFSTLTTARVCFKFWVEVSGVDLYQDY